VGHVHHQEGAVVVGDLAEAGVVPLARVGGAAGDDEGRLVDGRELGEPVLREKKEKKERRRKGGRR
jgi:hypothetical protein